MNKLDILLEVCDYLANDNNQKAKALIEKDYKHNYFKYAIRKMNAFEKLQIYIRDGFVDRYTGKRLLFPNVLRIMTSKLGNEVFPFHTNWKMSDCHIAYWHYMPTYDHLLPIARGGLDNPENIVTTSQIMNSSKSNFLIEELGWKLHDSGNIEEWDGMIFWYIKYRNKNNNILKDKYIKNWDTALEKCISIGMLKNIRLTTAST